MIHGNFERFVKEEVPELYACAEQGEQVYLIICGDFGGIWDESYNNAKRIQALKQLPFTILFIDGNHENFDLLKYGIADAKHLMNSGLPVKAYRFIYEDIVQLI